MTSTANAPEQTAEQILEDYARTFKLVHGQYPRVGYLSNQWFRVNGETVHRLTLMNEIERLRHLAQRKHIHSTDKGLVNRLISKLRGL